MYEYKTIHDIDLKDIEHTINNYAQKGWRLIQLLELKETQGFRVHTGSRYGKTEGAGV